MGLAIQQRFPDKRVLFVSAHVFKTQFTDSVIHNTTNDFINFYQSIDVLIIDDIQEITTAKTQQAFSTSSTICSKTAASSSSPATVRQCSLKALKTAC